MAFMETHYYSPSMSSNIIMNVFIPTPESGEQLTDMNQSEKFDYDNGIPVLYLLHGGMEDSFVWIQNSNVVRYAQKQGIALVMASAENSFYHNLKSGKEFETFFTEELPLVTRNLFPISRKREHTYIAGTSMGGYGAWYLALKRPDVFGKAASLSGALDIATMYQFISAGREDNGQSTWEEAFGNPKELSGSEHDILTLYKMARESGNVPELYQTVGTEDFIYPLNVHVKEELTKLCADLTYEEGPGAHEWDFWDRQIQRVLEWVK